MTPSPNPNPDPTTPADATRGAPAHRRGNLVRAITVGLAVGLVIGGLWLLWTGLRVRSDGIECGTLTTAECDLELEIAMQFSRTQIGLGLGLSLLGIGGLLWQSIEDRRRRRPPKEA